MVEENKLRIPKNKSKTRTIIIILAIVLGVLLVWFVMFAPNFGYSYRISSPKAEVVPEPIELTPASPFIQKNHTNSISVEFVLIPAGKFYMGSPLDEVDRFGDEGPRHIVHIENSYYLGRYEIIQKQWREVMGDNPSNFKGDDLPVENISWNDVQVFIHKLNEKEETNKYRLPSEAEWEYACRAGTTTRYSFGNDSSKLGEYAWYDDNSYSKTHPVGQKTPNPWGLYDMHGNVWEWCQDWHYGCYTDAPTDGSAWELGQDWHSKTYGNGTFRIVRGGHWDISAGYCRSALRGLIVPDEHYNNLGFRLLKET